jgi:hypothetical protein
MMTLVPMRGQENRARHVLKHYFEPEERFFDPRFRSRGEERMGGLANVGWAT